MGGRSRPLLPIPSTDPPTAACAYSIGMRAAVNFPDVAVFGLAPAAANGLVTLVADACRGGTAIPLGPELVGLLDNELRCVFAPIDPGRAAAHFATAVSWFRDEPLDMVQLAVPGPQRLSAVRSRIRTALALGPAGSRPHCELADRRLVMNWPRSASMLLLRSVTRHVALGSHCPAQRPEQPLR